MIPPTPLKKEGKKASILEGLLSFSLRSGLIHSGKKLNFE